MFEQHLSAAFDRIGPRRRGLDRDFARRDPGRGQSGGHSLGTIERSAEAVQLLGRPSAGAGIADDAQLPRILLIKRYDFLEGLAIFVTEGRRISGKFDLDDRRAGSGGAGW